MMDIWWRLLEWADEVERPGWRRVVSPAWWAAALILLVHYLALVVIWALLQLANALFWTIALVGNTVWLLIAWGNVRETGFPYSLRWNPAPRIPESLPAETAAPAPAAPSETWVDASLPPTQRPHAGPGETDVADIATYKGGS